MHICAVLFKLNLWETEDVLKLRRDDLLRDISLRLHLNLHKMLNTTLMPCFKSKIIFL